ncbi:AHH domain-containing protein [Archangium lansingense]|uniref:AHH domain-containing protein n=1 Tax=Archangium lansingense TaxID=2995310 RepID=UPI003B7BD846
MNNSGSGRRVGVAITLKELMQGSFELYGKSISDGRPNIRDFGPAPGPGVAMKRNEARKKQTDDTKKNRKKDDSQEEAAPHANPQNPDRAILSKGRNYNQNGATYIRGSRPAEYSTFPHLGPAAFQADVQSRASITQPSNFNPTLSGVSQPYTWRGHHLLPGEAFYTEDSTGKPIFDKTENFDILLQTPYDIDHGHNVILLPYEAWAVPVHALIHHPNQHNDYSREVLQRLKSIDNEIDTLRGQGKKHEAIVADVFNQLKDLETDLWNDIIDESRSAVRSAAEGQLYDGPWCRWKTQDGREYIWPSLW